MWLKLAGSVMVVAAGTFIGFSLARQFSERPRHIRHLISCLTSLKTYIGYVSMPLPEALRRCAGGAEGPVADLLVCTAGLLERQGWLTPRQALAEALTVTEKLALNGSEIELLLLLSSNLGLAGREEQQRYLTMVLAELAKVEEEALRVRDQNVKMYRYLGICGGLTVVILLV